MAYNRRIWEELPNSETYATVEDFNRIEEGIEINDASFNGGWYTVDGLTATFDEYFEGYRTGAITTNDLTQFYNGLKIQFEQGDVLKSAVITGVSDTRVLFFMYEGDVLEDLPIENVKFSNIKNPRGFDLDINKWTVTNSVGGSEVTSPVQYSWYNNGGEIKVPVGSWQLEYDIVIYCDGNTRGFNGFTTGFAWTPNEEPNGVFSKSVYFGFADYALLQIKQANVSIDYTSLSNHIVYVNTNVVYSNMKVLKLWSFGVRKRAICQYI